MNTRFIELAGEINTAHARVRGRQGGEALNERRQAGAREQGLLLGMAYKKDVDDPRESPSFELMDLLQERGDTRNATQHVASGRPQA
jgi:UDP-N-acetyl-D-glucosamine dehydrogenase